MSRSSPRSVKPVRWTPAQMIAFAVVLLLLLGYVYFRPALERRLGVKLPAIEGTATKPEPAATSPKPPTSGASAGTTTPKSGSASFQLKKLSGDRFESPAGLIYGPSGDGHRIEHVMLHAVDDPDRPQQHGVFDAGDRDGVLELLDEAYNFVKQNSGNVETAREGDRTVYTIDMGRRIGYVGGRTGKQKQFPPCRQIKLVLANRNVITAYPVK